MNSRFFDYKVAYAEPNATARGKAALHMGLAHPNIDFYILRDGEDTIKYAKMLDFDLIIASLQMPFKDGINTSHELRKFPNYSCVPIILYGENIAEHTAARAKSAGVNEIVSKDVSFESTIDSLIARYLPTKDPGKIQRNKSETIFSDQ